MPINVFDIDTTYRKILTYDSKRTSIIIRNMSSITDVYISYEPIQDLNKSFLLAPQDGLSLNKFFGDQVDLEMWAFTMSGTAKLAVIVYYEGDK